MTAGFMIQLVGSAALDFEDDGLMSIAPIGGPVGAALSTLAGRKLQVGASQFGDE
jgi:hypothetical protein